MAENDGGSEERGETPVHYQVSVTGRQAAAFLLGLLLSLCLAFFFGMKTGAASRKGSDAISQIAQVSDLPVPTLPPSERAAVAPAPAKKEPVPVETGEKRLGFDDAPPAVEPTKESKESKEPVAERKPVKETPKRPESRKEPASVSAPPTPAPQQATPAPKPASDVKPAAAPAKAKAEPLHFVQVLATKNATIADDVAKRLKKAGYKADVSVVPGRPDLFRVRAGPFAEKAKADAAAKKIRELEKALRVNPAVVNG